jgi:AAA+ ATPase superfamily predicted ATPase
MVSNIVGNTVQGEDFFDRERELASVLERIETDNVLLLAPRRVGKTSLMYRVREEATKRGHLSAYLSVADVNTEFQFVQKLYEVAHGWSPAKRAVKALAKGPLGRFMKRIKKLGVATMSIELADDGERLRFRSSLLRDFWVRRILP